jgi:NADP-dependent 3-hydroxy acid dehydrogenase YdfG
MTRTLILFGAGPGIGNHVASEFAGKGIEHVILLSRNTQRLQNEDAPFVTKTSSSTKVDTLRVDLADTKSIPYVLKQLDSMTEGEEVEVVFFNAARIKPSEVLGVTIEEIDEDFKVTALSLIPTTSYILIENKDYESCSLHHSTALCSQTPGPCPVQSLAQTGPSCHQQPSAVGSYTSTPLAELGEGFAEEHGGELQPRFQ